MKSGKSPSRSRPARVLVLAGTVLLLSTCQDFFGTEDLKQQIKDDVVDATAAEVEVNIASPDTSMGTPSPAGIRSWKVGVPNTITTSVNESYAFDSWTNDVGDVAFADIHAATTTATVNSESAETITISPSYDMRPYVDLFEPLPSSEADIKNSIKIWFSEDVDPSSIALGTTIRISTRPIYPSTPDDAVWVPINTLFNPPSVSDRLVTVLLSAGSQYSKNNYVRVELSKEIADLNGNSMSNSSTKTFTFQTGNADADTTPPQINAFTITNAEGREFNTNVCTNGTDIALNVSAADSAHQVVWIQVIETPCDSSGNDIGAETVHPWTSFASTLGFTLASAAEGYTKIQVRVADELNNETAITNTEVDTKIIQMDTTDPSQPSVSGAAPSRYNAGTYWYNGSDGGGVSFTLSSSDAGSDIYGFSTNSSGSNPVSNPKLSTSGMIYAVDNAGNVSAGMPVTVTLDSVLPASFTISTHSAEYPLGTGASIYHDTSTSTAFTFNSSDALSELAGYTTNLSGASPNFSGLTLSTGSTYTIYAVDYAGNVRTGPTVSVYQDITPPTLSITSTSYSSAADVYWYASGSVPLTLSYSNETGSGFQYYRQLSPTSSTFTGTSITRTAGTYTFDAVDNVGNNSPDRAITITQDDDNPDAPAVSSGYYFGSGAYWFGLSDSGVVFTLSSDDNGGSGIQKYQYRLSGTNHDTTAVTAALAAGSYTFRAVDNVGNTSAFTSSYTVSYDGSRPTQPTAASSYYSDGTRYWYPADDLDGVTFTLASTDTGSLLAGYLLDGAPVDSPQTRTAGTYNYYSIDHAGNTSASYQTVTIAQDSDLPTIGGTLAATDTVIGGFDIEDPAGGTGLDDTTYSASGGASYDEDNGELTVPSAPTDGNPVSYTLSVTDNAGNTRTVTVTHAWVSDGVYSAVIE